MGLTRRARQFRIVPLPLSFIYNFQRNNYASCNKVASICVKDSDLVIFFGGRGITRSTFIMKRLNKKFGNRRYLGIELLEQRALLSASPLDYEALTASYNLSLPDSSEDINIIQIAADELNAQTLFLALEEASQTKEDDLIVLQTTDENRTIDLGELTLTIDVSSADYGSVTLLGYGDSMPRITGSSQTLIKIENGTVQMGGIVLVGLSGSAQSSQTSVDNLIVCSDDAAFRQDKLLYLLQTSEVTILNNGELTDSSGTDSATDSEAAGALASDSLQQSASAAISSSSSGNLQAANSSTLSETTGYYSAEFNLSGTTQWVYVVGLTASDVTAVESYLTGEDREAISGLFIDAEKGSESEDSNLCWAGTTSNMLWYTGWANSELLEDGASEFSSVDDVFDYFVDHFSNEGGNSYYGNEWFITGDYEVQGKSGWAQAETDGGGFYTDVDYTSIAGTEEMSTASDMAALTQYLRSDYAIGLSIGWYGQSVGSKLGTRLGGHAITCWGYIYDTSYSSSSTSYYVSLLITDSDDSLYDGRSALNQLRTNDLTWDSVNSLYCMEGYSGSGYYAWLEGYVYLAPYTTSCDLKTENSGVLSSSSVLKGDSITISDIPISNIGDEEAESYTVTIYASSSKSNIASGTVLKTISGGSLASGDSTTLSATLDTSTLTRGSWYIGWVITCGGDSYSGNNTGYCTNVLTVTATDDDYETNDSLEQAANCGTITTQTTLSDLILAAGDEDWFSFTLAEEGTDSSSVAVDYTTTASQAILNLYIYDDSGSLVASTTGANAEKSVSLSGCAAGKYYARIVNYYSSYKVDPYALTITPPISLPDLASYTPSGWSGPIVVATSSDQTETANEITNVDRVYVNFALQNIGGEDVDGKFYITVTVDSDVLSSAVTRTYYLSSLSSGAYATLGSNVLNLGTLNPGTYTVTVDADAQNSVDESDETNNSWSLTFTVESAEDDYEPNDTISDAWDLGTSGVSVGFLAIANVKRASFGSRPGPMVPFGLSTSLSFPLARSSVLLGIAKSLTAPTSSRMKTLSLRQRLPIVGRFAGRTILFRIVIDPLTVGADRNPTEIRLLRSI